MTELANAIDPEVSPPSLVSEFLRAGVSIFSGRWKLSILWYLDEAPRRFGELSALLPGVTAKVLTYQLRELEEAGLISRAATNCPRKTEYALTESGIAAMPMLQLFWEWGNWYMRRQAKG
jgi:DNA-binding HxlR family transcriptional regulator